MSDDRRQVTSRIRLVEKVPELGGTYHMLFQDLHDVIAEFTAVRTGDSPRDALSATPRIGRDRVDQGGTAAYWKAIPAFPIFRRCWPRGTRC